MLQSNTLENAGFTGDKHNLFCCDFKDFYFYCCISFLL